MLIATKKEEGEQGKEEEEEEEKKNVELPVTFPEEICGIPDASVWFDIIAPVAPAPLTDEPLHCASDPR